jgi:hypothetical protein
LRDALRGLNGASEPAPHGNRQGISRTGPHLDDRLIACGWLHLYITFLKYITAAVMYLIS